MQVELVIHAYGPFYICLLAEQLRSLASHPSATATVLYCPEEAHLISEAVEGIDVNVSWLSLDKPQLCNRTIGRNMAAKASTADWVWFADADYLFGEGSIEAVANLDPQAACMYYPRITMRPRDGDYYDDWPEGDDAISHCTFPEGSGRAIGGMQIVPGNIARQYGYLDGVESHQRPAKPDPDGEYRMQDTKGDQAYRGWLPIETGLEILRADIPNIYRLRHRIAKTSARHRLLPMVE